MKIVKQDLTNWLVVGDVHNTKQYLVNILEKAQGYNGIVFVGDLIDRGPDPIGTIKLVSSLRQQTNIINIMGNHDWKLIRSFNGRDVTLFDPNTQALIRDNGLIDTFFDIYNEEIVGIFDTENKIFVSHAAGGKPLKILEKVYEAKRNENKFLFDDFDHFLDSNSHTVSRKVRDKLLYGMTTGRIIDDLPERLPILKNDENESMLNGWVYIHGHSHDNNLHPERVDSIFSLDFSAGQPNGKLAAWIIQTQKIGKLIFS